MEESKEKEKVKLLLVDDEVEFLNATSRALSRRGFEVTPAQNGNVARILLEQQTFDVAVLDVRMPGIQGDELFREIKTAWPELPVLLLTGHGTVQQAFQTSRDGIFEYLTKPIAVEKLARSAQLAVAAARKAREQLAGPGVREEIRLLLIDADAEFLQAVGRGLGRRGMRVTSATTAAEALRILEQQFFDVLLLDVKLPGTDGLELLRRIKGLQPLCEVILLTGHPSVGLAVEGIRSGAFDYVLKPHDVDLLAARILEADRHRRVHAEEARRRQISEILERDLE